MKPFVLFVCNENRGRSQMAEAFLRKIAQSRAQVASAGLSPAAACDETVAAAMAEVGVSRLGEPQRLTPELIAKADRIISLGCQPVPEKATDIWEIPDPVGKSLEEVRKIRDQLRARVDILAADLNVARPGTGMLPPLPQ